MNWEDTLQSLKAGQASGMTPFVVFESQEDIKDFVAAIKQDPELEDKGELQGSVNSKVFMARYGLGAKRQVSLLDIIEDCSAKVYFESANDLCLFASLFDDAIANGVIKENAEHGTVIIDYKKLPDKEERIVSPNSHTSAEDALNIVAIVFLVLSEIAGIVLIVNAITVAEIVGYVEILKIKIWIGAILILNGFVLWALFRVVANISQSLISINKKLKNRD